MTFDDMARGDDPSRIDEQLVVTVDAQLFYSVLNALPYLVNYPYECTEQTLNRFVSTGHRVVPLREVPAVAKMAEQFSKRDTRLETWDAADPNRKMALEETPWLELARGRQGRGPGPDATSSIPRIAQGRARGGPRRSCARRRPRSARFPWWPGGPPSPYMTLYILYGFAQGGRVRRGGSEGHGAARLAVRRASTTATTTLRRMARGQVRLASSLTFLNYVASCYPDASLDGRRASTPEERAAILDFSFKHWKEHSPYLKGYLALTLKRMARPQDARLVWDERHGLGEDRSRTSARTGRPRTARGSGTTTRSRRRPSRCGPSWSSNPRTPGGTAWSSGSS